MCCQLWTFSIRLGIEIGNLLPLHAEPLLLLQEEHLLLQEVDHPLLREEEIFFDKNKNFLYKKTFRSD